MPISLNKLESLIESKGMMIKKIFTISSEIVYLEIFNFITAEIIYIYIPSKYVIKADNRDNIYKIKYIEMDENESDLIKKETKDVENQYDEIHIDNDEIIDNKDLEKNMKENYDKQITLDSLKKEDKENMKDIIYQLLRLKLCVQHIKYKLTIIYKNYLCCIKRDNSIECYIIKHFPKSTERRIYISTDLENLYLKINYISQDVKKIKNGIYKVLYQNQIKHNKILLDLFQQKDKINMYSQEIIKKKNEIDDYNSKLEELLKKINENQDEVYTKMINIQNKYKQELSLKGFHDEIQMAHEISIEEKKLENINITKEEIVQNIVKNRIVKDNLTLMIDKILFDNSIMLNTIILNLRNLSSLLTNK